MTTEGELIPVVRDVNILLELDTYQGMSDAEIQSLIDYHVSCAKDEGALEERGSARRAREDAQAAAHLANVQAAGLVLQSMLELEIPWVTVGSDS